MVGKIVATRLTLCVILTLWLECANFGQSVTIEDKIMSMADKYYSNSVDVYRGDVSDSIMRKLDENIYDDIDTKWPIMLKLVDEFTKEFLGNPFIVEKWFKYSKLRTDGIYFDDPRYKLGTQESNDFFSKAIHYSKVNKFQNSEWLNVFIDGSGFCNKFEPLPDWRSESNSNKKQKRIRKLRKFGFLIHMLRQRNQFIFHDHIISLQWLAGICEDRKNLPMPIDERKKVLFALLEPVTKDQRQQPWQPMMTSMSESSPKICNKLLERIGGDYSQMSRGKIQELFPDGGIRQILVELGIQDAASRWTTRFNYRREADPSPLYIERWINSISSYVMLEHTGKEEGTSAEHLSLLMQLIEANEAMSSKKAATGPPIDKLNPRINKQLDEVLQQILDDTWNFEGEFAYSTGTGICNIFHDKEFRGAMRCFSSMLETLATNLSEFSMQIPSDSLMLKSKYFEIVCKNLRKFELVQKRKLPGDWMFS